MRDLELWSKLEAFTLDDPKSNFNFSQRLARDNKWSHQFSLRVITEYKKFIYLCCVGYGEITPSDAVDQAWHLHLTYTRSYWTDMCKNTVGKQIHHNPTKGGELERKRYSNDYDALQDAYLKEFKEEAPGDIWPTNEKRFSQINFKRINLSDYWLIKKPGWSEPRTVVFFLPLIAILFIQSDNPVPWGSLILVVILLLFVARAIMGGGKGGGGSNSGCSSWGCSGDSHSGCSSHGCSSGCGGGD